MISNRKKEGEANHFAFCLLMPEKHVREEIEQRGLGDGMSEENVDELAGFFNVSPIMMTMRIMQIGYIF